ncbi:hypothetical protein ASPFODRAFT_38924 [Aspergillus luchuensis CBS 106.47]|uniref:Uncharacterized protein n=1 Tax=Aspergillus luchuensis (strain CBS 106.47) TaxID=1137211 RepID=A0A1M3TY80_ASPLC|nr:hypothetical protein ASPFODRAFT_38924 [Aspergillus luchuensis CBS 106.47]
MSRQPVTESRNEHLQAGSCQIGIRPPLVPDSSCSPFLRWRTPTSNLFPTPDPARTTHHLIIGLGFWALDALGAAFRALLFRLHPAC